VHTEIDELEKQLVLAHQMQIISHLELLPSHAFVVFSPEVTYKKIHDVVHHINRKYKRVAWIPGSVYLTNPSKHIKIHYKRDHA
jgi:hypothetical protein